MIEIIINNNKYFFDKPITVLQACEQVQITIPRFCYHEKLSVAGNCRMCLVEIEKSPKPVASCAMPINNGMVIFTETPLVKKAREAVLEFLLINHPLDCPICDQGGECDLQDITLTFGSDRSRFFEIKRGVEDKECGPIVKTIMTRCIHCTRCIRFLTELAGMEVFGAIGRGEVMEIGTYLNKYLRTELSGNLVDLCPVGALTSKPYAFLARNWELKKIETVDFSDAIGSNIVVHVRNSANIKNFESLKLNDQILRILPKLNNEINENWISDKTRYSFDGLYLNRNLLLEFNFHKQSKQVGFWNINLLKKLFLTLNDFGQDSFLQKKNLIGILGTISSVEECFFFFQFLKSLGTSNILINKNIYHLNNDLPNFYLFNSKIVDIEKSDLILLVNVNPRFESSMLNLKLRKHFFNKEVVIGYFGANIDFNFFVEHLGNSTKKFLELVEGKLNFCKKIRASKNPFFIFGSNLGYRQDSKVIQNMIRFLIKKTFLNLKNNCGINFLAQNLTQIQSVDLGINLNAKSPLYHLWKNPLYLKQSTKSNYILNNLDFSFPMHPKSQIICSLNSHNIFLQNSLNFNIPINSLFEKESLLLNVEGRVQKSFKVITPNKNSRNSEDFFKVLLKLNKKINKTLFLNQTLFLEAPFLKILNKNLRTESFYYNFFLFKEFEQKLKFSSFKQTIPNFYLTNNFCKNSKIMSECALFLTNKSNFF